MLNTQNNLSTTWVKNVYSLCVQGMVTSARSYTGWVYSTVNTASPRVQPLTYTHSVNSFPPSLYTLIFRLFNLLSIHLYTLSTPPTINKMKKK